MAATYILRPLGGTLILNTVTGPPPPLQYITVVWRARDMKAVWKARDEKVTWKVRS